jgi:Extensin-like protein C-terminus
VRGWKLANGQSVGLTDRNAPRELRETVLHSVCARFMTVLGPGSDGYHEDHIHLDLMERHNNYKICQWNVWDPMPQVAPLMPAERPAEAPPRQVADHATKDDEAKPAGQLEARPDAKPDAKPDTTKPKPSAEPQEDADSDDAEKAKSQPDKPESAKSESGQSQPDKAATKKRRQNRRS